MRTTIPVTVLLSVAAATRSQQVPTCFDAPVVAIDSWSRFDELVDLDLDGDLDSVGIYLNQQGSSSNPAFLQMKLHRNDGHGVFTSSVLYSWPTTGGTPTFYRSAVGDVDGDGHPDVVTPSGGQVWVLLGRPGQPLVRTLNPVNGLSLQFQEGVRLADVNGDGLAEMVTVDTFYGLRVFNLSTATFSQRSIAVPNPSSTELAILDANGDGLPDAAVVDGGTLRLYAITSAGVIAPFASYVLPLGISSYGSLGHLVAGDVDNDGDTDLVVFADSGQYAFVERTGPAQFVVHAAAVGGPATNLFDYDGDGDLDGCCCGGGGNPLNSPNYQPGHFEVAENLGGGVFAPSWQLASLGPYHLAGCADVDGDGQADLVGGRCVYFGHGKHNPTPTLMATRPLSRPVDVDRDGDPDVIDPIAGRQTNLGNGGFTASTSTLPPLPAGQSWQVRSGCFDLDQDGDVDLLAQHLTGSLVLATHLLRNAGGGHFVDAGVATTTGAILTGTEPMFAGDFDGDGDVDLVFVNDAQTVQVWWQTGGQFAPGLAWPMHRVLATEDFDRDGRVDLLVASYPYWPSVSFMQLRVESWQAPGNFVSQLVGPPTLSLQRPGIADLDGDGDLDLMLSGQLFLEPWFNAGSGNFVLGTTIPDVSTAPDACIQVADVDHDGRWDVVCGPAGYYDVLGTSGFGTWVVRQLAPGQFTPVLHPTKFGWPTDLDGDGDLDLMGPEFVRNLVHDGAAAGAREQFGTASAGTDGARPTLGATGPFRAGSTMVTHVTGGYGQSLALILASLDRLDPPVVLPGFTVYLQAPIALGVVVLDGTAGTAGVGSGDWSWTLPANAAGFTVYQQAVLLDPAGVAPGLTHTAALRTQFGW